MTEALIAELSRLQSFVVSSRTSAAHYYQRGMSVPEIAEALGVDIVIEGSLIRHSSTCRIFISIIDGIAVVIE